MADHNIESGAAGNSRLPSLPGKDGTVEKMPADGARRGLAGVIRKVIEDVGYPKLGAFIFVTVCCAAFAYRLAGQVDAIVATLAALGLIWTVARVVRD